jgi:glutamate racemase
MKNNVAPIGVFDSGIGGLTVVKHLIDALPNENIVYFGDTARVPYGSKSNDTVIEYSIQNAAFLMEFGVKAIVVACNTASSVAMQSLRDKFNVPVIGMIEPGTKYGLGYTSTNKIGVIGTRSTIGNNAYSKKINEINPEVEVFEKACPLFVPFAEEGWIDHPATKAVAEEYLGPLKNTGIDTLILGCTHYPILRNVIQTVMGPQIKLVDSGIAASYSVVQELTEKELLNPSNSPGSQLYFVSDVPTTFTFVASLFLGKEIHNVKKVETDYISSLFSIQK